MNTIMTPTAAARRAANLVVSVESILDADGSLRRELVADSQAAEKAALAVFQKAGDKPVAIWHRTKRCRWSTLFQRALDAAEKAVDERLRDEDD